MFIPQRNGRKAIAWLWSSLYANSCDIPQLFVHEGFYKNMKSSNVDILATGH